MSPTSTEVSGVFKQALNLIDNREKDYQGSWKDEGLHAMVDSAYRKANYNRMRFENGRWKDDIAKTKEDLLDAINYSAFAYRLLELEIKGE